MVRWAKMRVLGILPEDFEWGMGGDAAAGEPTGEGGEEGHQNQGEERGEEGRGEGDFEDGEGEDGGGGQGEDHSGGGGQGAQDGVFHAENISDLGLGGSEDAEEDAFLKTLVASAEDGGDEDQKTGGHGEAGHESNGEGDAVEDVIEGSQDDGDVDGGDVGELADDLALKGGGGLGRFDAGDEDVKGGGVIEGAEGKDDEEVGLDSAPIHLAQAGDLGFEGNALDVPLQSIAETDAEFAGDAVLDGHGDEIGIGGDGGVPGAGDQGFALAELGGKGGAELTTEGPTGGVDGGVGEDILDGSTGNGHEAHGDNGGLIEDGEVLGLEQLGDGLGLVGLDVEEDGVATAGVLSGDQLFQEDGLGQLKGDEEEGAEAEGDDEE